MQLPGQPATTCEQSTPAKPTSQLQANDETPDEETVAWQTPWPVQLLTQTVETIEQSSPLKPTSQRHVPNEHAPWPEQLYGQLAKAETMPQASPE